MGHFLFFKQFFGDTDCNKILEESLLLESSLNELYTSHALGEQLFETIFLLLENLKTNEVRGDAVGGSSEWH